MHALLKAKKYQWIDSFADHPIADFKIKLEQVMGMSNLGNNELVFLCVGTPHVLGDSLGPAVGTLLNKYGCQNVYGSLVSPVHALNIQDHYRLIADRYSSPFIIAIDAALGKKNQAGLITIKNGPLYPGKGVGKKIPPVGNLEITGVFDRLDAPHAFSLLIRLITCISNGILKTF